MYQKEGLDKTTHPGGHVTKSYTYREYLGSLALNPLKRPYPSQNYVSLICTG